MQLKDNYENSNMGDYQNLYPLPLGVNREQDQLMELYDYIYYKKAKQAYEETVIGGGLSKLRKEEYN